jgi:2-polyprenyl-3-methyl-5-hydroxy-6-metoxy-1,4-benzoquinol methylase
MSRNGTGAMHRISCYGPQEELNRWIFESPLSYLVGRLAMTKRLNEVSGLYEFGGSIEHLRKLQRKFLKYFPPRSTVVDLGCGRGVFLELLAENGIKALGVDSNGAVVQFCKSRGITDVYSEDIIEFLRGKVELYDGIFCSHVIEHLDYSSAVSLLHLCGQALKPNGVMVLVTPNPLDITVMGDIYWLDPSHVRPYPASLLKSMLHKEALIVREIGYFRGVDGARLRARHIVLSALLGNQYGKENLFVVSVKSEFCPKNDTLTK